MEYFDGTRAFDLQMLIVHCIARTLMYLMLLLRYRKKRDNAEPKQIGEIYTCTLARDLNLWHYDSNISSHLCVHLFSLVFLY